MKKFDKIAEELGWIKPYEEVPLWYKCEGRFCIGKFSINEDYENWGDLDSLDEKGVSGRFNYYTGNTFSEVSKDWVLPMLASDYYYHRGPVKYKDMELKYALIALEADPKLGVKTFSSTIKEELEDKLKSNI